MFWKPIFLPRACITDTSSLQRVWTPFPPDCSPRPGGTDWQMMAMLALPSKAIGASMSLLRQHNYVGIFRAGYFGARFSRRTDMAALETAQHAPPLASCLAHHHQGYWFKQECSCWGAQQQETQCRSSAGQSDPQPQEPLPRGLWWPRRARSLLRMVLLGDARRTSYTVPLQTWAAHMLCKCFPCSVSGLGLSPAIRPNQGRGGIQYPRFVTLWSKQDERYLSLSC